MDQMLIDKAFILLFFGGALYFMIFHTQKYKEVNDLMYDNIRRTTGGMAKAGKVGFSLFRMFKGK